MSNKMICPFCGYELQENRTTNLCCPICGLIAPTKLWQALIQSRQQLKMLEPIVASLQGRADINAEEARDSNELVVQWYEKYEQSQKDLEIARKALGQIAELALAHDDISIADEVVGVFYALNQQDFADKIREQIEHFADVSNMVEHKE